MRLYSLSWLARLSGKSPRTFHRWERDGCFPQPILSLNDGYRWFTAAEVNGYAALVKACGIRMGRNKKNTEPKSLWLKRNAFELKRLIKEHLDKKFDSFPDRLAEEDAIIKSLAKSSHLRMPQERFIKLITGASL